jgi:hypothetical protein
MGELTAHIYKLSLNVFTMIHTPPSSSDLRDHSAILMSKSCFERILIIGSKDHSGAKCVEWTDPFPNIADYDAVIVNLQTLDKRTLELIGSEKLKNCSFEISQLLKSKGTLFMMMTAPLINLDGDLFTLTTTTGYP